MRSLIVIPTYNELENLASLTSEIHKVVPAADILIIDDNSPDGTGKLADQLVVRNSQISVLHRPGKLGYGTAYVQGFNYAIDRGYEAVVQMDADCSHDPECLPELLRGIEEADIVIGSRYVEGGSTPDWPWQRKLISFGGNSFARLMLGIPVHDCTSGFRCYRTEALGSLDWNSIRSKGYAFQIETAYLLWKRGYHILEVPISFSDRRMGTSKISRNIALEAALWVTSTRFSVDR